MRAASDCFYSFENSLFFTLKILKSGAREIPVIRHVLLIIESGAAFFNQLDHEARLKE